MNLIPKPAHIEVTGGYFKVDSNLVFGNDQSGTIRYVVDESFNGGNPEGYALNVTKKGIELRAASKSGLFYGEQTLRIDPRQSPFPVSWLASGCLSSFLPERGGDEVIERHVLL